jgi:hypothetical protein
MRVASSPTLRIAAGLLLAALLSIVGYKVFRRSISHGPEALPERADDPSWLASLIYAQPMDLPTLQNLIKPHPSSRALPAIASRVPARFEILISTPNANLDSMIRPAARFDLVRHATEQAGHHFRIMHLRTAAEDCGNEFSKGLVYLTT